MSRIITAGHTSVHNIRPFHLTDMTCAVEAADRAPWLASSIVPRAEVDESMVRPFALYASPANSDAGNMGHARPAPEMEAVASRQQPGEPLPAETPTREISHAVAEAPQFPVDDLAEAATRAAADAAARAVAGAVETLERERTRLLQTAQEEATRCLAQAQEQTASLSEEAYQHGFQQGEAAARREITAQLAPILSAFQQAAGDLASLRTTVLQQAEDDVIDLAFQLARKIIAHEVLEHHHVLQATLKRVLAQVADQDRLVIHVHPDDLQQATLLQQDVLGTLGDVKAISLQADAAIGRGGCLVETTLGTIDARIDAQLEELEQRFRGQHLLNMQARVA